MQGIVKSLIQYKILLKNLTISHPNDKSKLILYVVIAN